jgi:hypothetical protein
MTARFRRPKHLKDMDRQGAQYAPRKRRARGWVHLRLDIHQSRNGRLYIRHGDTLMAYDIKATDNVLNKFGRRASGQRGLNTA